jgi:branched-chain amino acid transport system substrate-binding protein
MSPSEKLLLHSDRDAGVDRRHAIGIAAAVALGATGLSVRGAAAEDETVKIAVIAPLAGAFAASGQDLLHGAQLARDEVNAAGGIKSLGGRKLEFITGDAGQSPETTVTTARRVFNGHPVAAIGSWYSSLTLAGTQVAEQRKIPWLTGSVADAIVGRGFKYSYQISAGSEASAAALIDAFDKIGSGQLRLALLTDNNAANVDVLGFIKRTLSAPPVSEQSWTPPLADATPAVSALIRAKPTVIFLGATSTTDQALVIKQLAAQGNTAAIVMGASSAANPTFLDTVGAKAMEGVVVVTGVSFPGKGAEEINRKYSAATKLPFMDCEALDGYSNIHIIAAALEQAGKADPEAVKQALDTMDARDVAAFKLLPSGNRLRFTKNGRREGVVVEFVQWQGGRPLVVFPPDVANGELKRQV